MQSIHKALKQTSSISFLQQFAFSEAAGNAKYKVVFLRHGESQWNKENRFTGWYDVALSPKGVEEARAAGKTLKQNGYKFDICFTSVLTRAITTLNYTLDELGTHYLPVNKHWRLNERHYGALQGLNKSETAEKHGEEQVKIWRRSYDIPPPALEQTDERFPGFDPRYAQIPKDHLPTTESLELCVERVLPYWYDAICPAVLSGKSVVVCAHGNSLRSIIKHIDNVSKEDIIGLNIPTAIPLVYEFDENMVPVKNYYLADPEELKQKMNAVANQGKKQ
ncbi:hypothetical protein PPERSA_11884 [Pseudocohnilembus persalinus]|uniref:phosphoglycerate mutase (2,3-diphosphoglycerate-dependent) n=1 Tax=Pseudocohnilembus persalinus TaxID=266149 RepID=A0A0V0QKG7_PSEPJ|nr:hypothetical protein PPERSA_11884 [Pseudocohnilembus persalinus]|eukprot:KRX02544.1 hypothetical protein PPERSA_11884 [Pseudocohnilembus persalinus]